MPHSIGFVTGNSPLGCSSTLGSHPKLPEVADGCNLLQTPEIAINSLNRKYDFEYTAGNRELGTAEREIVNPFVAITNFTATAILQR